MLYLIGIIVLIYILILIYSYFSKLGLAKAKAKEHAFLLKERIQQGIDKIVDEKSQGFPWVANIISEYIEFEDLQIANKLERKRQPAIVEAKRIREIAKEKRIFKKEFLITKNLLNYFLTLFPWLSEYIGENLDDLIRQVSLEEKQKYSEDDPVKIYLPISEYSKLSETERNQKALDRYLSTRKQSWQIGRDYERYIGYLYEKEGFNVNYQGIELGLEDLGRDLI